MRWENYPDYQAREAFKMMYDDFDFMYDDMPGVQACYEWCVEKWFDCMYVDKGKDAPKYEDYVGEYYDRIYPGLFDVISAQAQWEVRANPNSMQRERRRAELISEVAGAAIIVAVPAALITALVYLIGALV